MIEALDLEESIRIAPMDEGAPLGQHRGSAVEILPIADRYHQ